jgi:dCMP deaminase
MEQAFSYAKRSTCVARKVGALFVIDNIPLIGGYNGVPRKMEHPTVCKRRELGLKSGEQPHLCGCQHAEANAIANAARKGIALENSTLYCTSSPCSVCFGQLINCGVREIVYAEAYPGVETILAEADKLGVIMRHVGGKIREQQCC